MENELKHNVFVYGTLKQGECNHRVMERLNHKFLSIAQIRGDKFRTSYGFPCLVEGLGLVDGEVYAVDDEAVRDLDTFEGVPHLYERRQVRTLSGLEVNVYFGTGAQRGIIQDQA